MASAVQEGNLVPRAAPGDDPRAELGRATVLGGNCRPTDDAALRPADVLTGVGADVVADVEFHPHAAGSSVPGGPAATRTALGERSAAEHPPHHHAALGVDVLVQQVVHTQLLVVELVGLGAAQRHPYHQERNQW